ncbi:MAG: hypothetical protein M5U28_14255 [Sandaracinaceae bacterium]|nr:hypothetical protein [Sandaracinaceae bacterium]
MIALRSPSLITAELGPVRLRSTVRSGARTATLPAGSARSACSMARAFWKRSAGSLASAFISSASSASCTSRPSRTPVIFGTGSSRCARKSSLRRS